MNLKVNDTFINIYPFKYILLFVFLTANISPVFSQGDLLIYPKRVVFDGKKKVEKLVISNTGKDSAVYNISFLEYKMNENGELKIISAPEEGINFASSHVRVFPRKVTLAPGEGQTVKVQLNNTQNLSNGEYRSHLYFRAEEEKGPLGQTGKRKDSTISVKLTPIYGISIPCIVRIGENTTSAAISDIQFVEENILKFKLNRTGNMSLYGDFTINYIASDGKIYEVAKTKGVGVYTPNLIRNMEIKLKKPENVNFTGGNFKVIYFQNESKKVLAENDLKL
ncbi:MAG: molecular chaperone [Lutibacter sp.]|nr:molecular chaperone [Lutibacter sp.]